MTALSHDPDVLERRARIGEQRIVRLLVDLKANHDVHPCACATERCVLNEDWVKDLPL